MSPACATAGHVLPAVVDDALDSDTAEHVDRCLLCQAHSAQYRRIARVMRSFEPQLALVPVGLHAAVMSTLADAHARHDSWQRALIGVGGLLVAAAGTTAGIWLTRSRHRVGRVTRLAS